MAGLAGEKGADVVCRERGEALANLGKRDSLAGEEADQAEAQEVVRGVGGVLAAGAGAGEEALGDVVADGAHRDSGGRGQLVDSEGAIGRVGGHGHTI